MTNTLDDLSQTNGPDPMDAEAATPIDSPSDSTWHEGMQEPETGVVWSRFAILLGFFAFVILVGGPNAIAFVIAIVAALVIHEGGHFLVGRWSGMLVTEYFIGFGPRIFSFRRGETVYGLKAIPFGAYVRIVGMNNLEEVHPALEARTYRQASWYKRVLTILAGPATHFVIALLLMVVYLAGQGRPINPDDAWAINTVVPLSVAEEAGLLPEDQIIELGGVDTSVWEDLGEAVSTLAGQETDLTFVRDGQEQTIEVRIGERLTQAGAEGFNGLYYADRIIGFEGQEVANYAEFAELANERVGETVVVTVEFNQEVTDQRVDIVSVADPEGAVSGFLGVSPGQAFEAQTFSQALSNSPAEVGTLISDIAARTPSLVSTAEGRRSLFGLTAFDEPEARPVTEDVDGSIIEFRPTNGDNFDENRPISLLGLTVIASAIENGWFVLFLVIIMNLFFGMFNLLPLLPLDGGHITLATYEKVRSLFSRERYAADAAKLLPVTYVVFGFMMLVSMIALIRDVFDFVIPS